MLGIRNLIRESLQMLPDLGTSKYFARKGVMELLCYRVRRQAEPSSCGDNKIKNENGFG